MARSRRRQTNELEFQGQVIVWLNDAITRRYPRQVDTATQEKPRLTSGKRSDLIVWTNRKTENAFLAIELKTPSTPINDPDFVTDAVEKAFHWKANYFAVWNMREYELYRASGSRKVPLPTETIAQSTHPLRIASVEDWLKPSHSNNLREQANEILEAALVHHQQGDHAGHAIDPEIFVDRLTDSIEKSKHILYEELHRATKRSRKLRKRVNTISAEQGFMGFVEDIDYAIAGQIAHRLIGQILFYYALRRKIPTLRPLEIAESQQLPGALSTYWNDVRRYDYEALFKPEAIDTLIKFPEEAQNRILTLIENLAEYDWTSLTDDVLGSIFERLIPRDEQVLLGQFYTPRPVADLLVAFTVDGERPLVLDPGCGSGTILMAVYSYLSYSTELGHKELLSLIWGFDISPFAAELAVINLFRQDMSEYENFPRIVSGSFFDRTPKEIVKFPVSRKTGGTEKVSVSIPRFDCIVGNPPYLRSQNQDDLDPMYRQRLFSAAKNVSILAPPKTDLFAFFVYHSLQFLNDGSRIGFVTPASWLTADFARPLQEALISRIRLVAVIASNAESFFPQVEVNTVLLVAEKISANEEEHSIRFVMLKQPITRLTSGRADYWKTVVNLVDEIESTMESTEDHRLRVKVVDSMCELDALNADSKRPRNWSRYLRAPLSYYEIFEGGA